MVLASLLSCGEIGLYDAIYHFKGDFFAENNIARSNKLRTCRFRKNLGRAIERRGDAVAEKEFPRIRAQARPCERIEKKKTGHKPVVNSIEYRLNVIAVRRIRPTGRNAPRLFKRKEK